MGAMTAAAPCCVHAAPSISLHRPPRNTDPQPRDLDMGRIDKIGLFNWEEARVEAVCIPFFAVNVLLEPLWSMGWACPSRWVRLPCLHCHNMPYQPHDARHAMYRSLISPHRLLLCEHMPCSQFDTVPVSHPRE